MATDVPLLGNEVPAPRREVLSAAALAGRPGPFDVCFDEEALDGGVVSSLVPQWNVRGRLNDGLPTPDLHGKTLHPGDEPTEAEKLAEAEARVTARVTARVDGLARQVLAQARVTSGLVDPYFGDLRRQIAQDIASAPDFTAAAKHVPIALFNSWQTGAERYGKSGAPFEAPVTRDLPELPSALQREVDRGSTDAKVLAMQLTAGARLRDFADGKMGAELYAEVEVRQGPGAELEGLRLVLGSGISSFDTWVVERAGAAVSALGPRDTGRGLHSVWGFKGKVVYWRSTRDLNFKDDAWYLALMALPGMATGRFDPVSGTADVVDLRHPHYECKVELVRVY